MNGPTRIDGHGCQGCINLMGIEVRHRLVNYCNKPEYRMFSLDSERVVLDFPIIDNPLVKPSWCYLND